ncbi:CYFA0S15e00320g1_1 [Cyberlindnera fabianii]|uniref:CYFA0S15e00320g1_1 n=1 Tax=Cyberlindnera fabianii TaxID=36022 RepID=A0A061B9N2_CYBFA|nr:Golgi apyrase [Cyberlindnera fabianii]CDR44590.1 CYFA0S15e00320g1_1 [Cyberlindnera fabianii]
MAKDHYGIVIDSGSSGSRIQIYAWPDSAEVVKEAKADSDEDQAILHSVPRIRQEESWTFKTTPGVSTFGDKPDDVWDDHYESLFEYAEKIIPRDKWEETPIFVLATAGMRLLPQNKRERLLQEICHKIDKKTDFKLENCAEQVQIIDGETEGMYGWIGLNYLMGQLDNYDPKKETHPSYGFMDMGGASTQISFVPLKKSEIEKHRDDISTLYLRSVDGDIQQWDIFVSTWLGFGANEARKRYLKNLINILPEKNNSNDEDDYQTTRVNDPCLPKGAKLDFLHFGHTYDIIGSGNFEQCLKTTYPLLLKNLPCIDEPCLFNGVHAPEIDFEKDKFVGISEYWYTANDVFHMGGEYNFLKFSEKVKQFCESDWETINKNSEAGEYNGLPNSLLIDACFKANWVLNVLHEGFNLPRVDIEKKVPEEVTSDNGHIPFQSAGSIKGSELSWTLGRILLYASSMIPAVANSKQAVGIAPAQNEHKEFISGGITKGSKYLNFTSSSSGTSTIGLLFYFLLFALIATLIYFLIYKPTTLKRFPSAFHQAINKVKAKYNQYKYTKLSNQIASDLEGGFFQPQGIDADGFPTNDKTSGSMSPSLKASDFATNLRTRSYANLQTSSKQAFTPKKNINTARSLLDLSEFRPGGEAGFTRSQSANSFLDRS